MTYLQLNINERINLKSAFLTGQYRRMHMKHNSEISELKMAKYTTQPINHFVK